MKGVEDASERDRAIASQLHALRRELLAEFEQCEAEGRSASDNADVEEDAYSSTEDILRHLSLKIREVEAALERVRAGKYGLCADCGVPIGVTRLRAVPTARRCARCQVGLERKAG